MDDEQLVVGVALVAEGRVLAARRTHPPELAGRWELPGGKVRPGEDPADAAVREVAEELGCQVRITGWLSLSVPIAPRLDSVEHGMRAQVMKERMLPAGAQAGEGSVGGRSFITSVRSVRVLRVAAAELVAGEPVPVEHDAVMWLCAGQLVGPRGWTPPAWLDWLESDRPFLPLVAELLSTRAAR